MRLTFLECKIKKTGDFIIVTVLHRRPISNLYLAPIDFGVFHSIIGSVVNVGSQWWGETEQNPFSKDYMLSNQSYGQFSDDLHGFFVQRIVLVEFLVANRSKELSIIDRK
jgi:hypothetical protein